MYDLTRINPALDFWYFAESRIVIGIGLPLIFISITMASYDGIPPDKTDQASALINVARNVGASIGIALALNVLADRQQFHQSRLVEHIVPSGIPFQETLQRMTAYFARHAGSPAEARHEALAWIARQVQFQASLLAYMDVFWVLMLVAAAAIPLALVLRNVKLGSNEPIGH